LVLFFASLAVGVCVLVLLVFPGYGVLVSIFLRGVLVVRLLRRVLLSVVIHWFGVILCWVYYGFVCFDFGWVLGFRLLLVL